jgi:hypothetical protein
MTMIGIIIAGGAIWGPWRSVKWEEQIKEERRLLSMELSATKAGAETHLTPAGEHERARLNKRAASLKGQPYNPRPDPHQWRSVTPTTP